MKERIRQYKKEFSYSYTLGAYPTIEMLLACPELIIKVYYRSNHIDTDGLFQLCGKVNISIECDDSVFKRLNLKDNVYVLGLFHKFSRKLSSDAPHVVLINPSDMGNLGTVIRTMAGLNFLDLGIITPTSDVWNPKTVRASMGSIFRLNIEHFDSFECYSENYIQHEFYPFMLDGKVELPDIDYPKNNRFSLIFGNEATELPKSYHQIGTSVKLPQSMLVDSLNLAVATGIGMFWFANRK